MTIGVSRRISQNYTSNLTRSDRKFLGVAGDEINPATGTLDIVSAIRDHSIERYSSPHIEDVHSDSVVVKFDGIRPALGDARPVDQNDWPPLRASVGLGLLCQSPR